MTNTRRRSALDLKITARAGSAYLPFLRKMVRRAHLLARSPLRELSVALVGDREMAKLHDRFMGKPNPTDVLTFPLEEDSRGRAISGEIVICVPEALRQAKARNVAIHNELLLYALHGMLHLLGMDDRTDADHRRMHRLEDRILTKLGVGAVFNPSQPRSARPSTSATS